MRLKPIILGLTCTLLGAILFVRHSGGATMDVRDVSKKEEVHTKAPIFPFRSGALRVHAKGNLDGAARLHIYSNHDRDYSAVEISGSMDREVYGVAEAWVDTLRVVYEPLSVKDGTLNITLRCGR